MQLSDVLIHINEMPNESAKNDLVEELRKLEGVIAPRFSQEKEHMLFVSYNSEAIDSATLIEKVRENAFEAQLIGM